MSKWPLVRLGDVCEINHSKLTQDLKKVVWNITLDQIQSNTGKILEKKYSLISEAPQSTNFVDQNNVLYSKLRPNLNKVIIPDEPGFATSELVPLKPDQKTLSKFYLMYFLRNPVFVEWATQTVAGAKMPRLTMSEFWEYKIPLPPLDEQQRIVDLLDRAQALVDKRTEQIALMDTLAQSLFHDMFGDPVKNEKGWEMKPLQKLTTKIGSGATPRGGDSAYKTSGIPLIRSLNIRLGSFLFKDLAYLDDAQAQALDNVIVKKNDVLLNITGASVARVCIVPECLENARVNQHVSIIRCTEEITPEFLSSCLLNNSMQTHLWSIAESGATRQAITKQQIELLLIPVPPIYIQTSFYDKKQKLAKQLSAMQTGIEETQSLFSSLMQEAFG